MTPKQKTPAVKSLSRFFIFTIVLIVAAITFALYTAFDTLPPYAATVNQKLTQANLISDEKTSPTSNLARRSALFFSTPSAALDQAGKDIRAYSQLSNVPVASITQNGQATTTTVPIRVSIDKPIPYASLMQFLATIEGNVPHLSITSLEVRQAGEDSQDVQVANLSINVAIK